jgi:hypothetical protein
MTDHLQPLFSPTIAFTVDEARWLYQALDASKKVVATALFEKGSKPGDDEGYRAFDLLAERCLAFCMLHPDPKE